MAIRGSGDLVGRIKPIGGGPHNAPMRSIPTNRALCGAAPLGR